jgi:SPP1 family predicted phage head-tail adaptor
MKPKQPLVSRLIHWITIQAHTPQVNLQGTVISVWNTTCHCWAEINPVNDLRYRLHSAYLAGLDIPERPHAVITIRYQEGIEKGMRIRHKTKIYIIRRILNPLESSTILTLIAEEELHEQP